MRSKRWLGLALALFVTMVFAREAFCDPAMDANVNAVSHWTFTSYHGTGGGTVSAISADTELAPDGSAVMRCAITAPASDIAGRYAETRWTNGSTPLDLRTYCRMNFWYKIDEIPDGAVLYPSVRMTDNPGWIHGFIFPPSYNFITDGQWHMVEWSFNPFNATYYTGGEWSWENVSAFQLNLALQNPAPEDITVNFHFGGFHFVPKSESPAYLLLGNSWAGYAPNPQVADMLEGLGFKCAMAAYDSALTLDYLKQFNLVVLLYVPSDNPTVEALLLNYVQQGGGLLVLRSPTWEMGDDIDRTNSLLSPTNIQILPEQVFEDTNKTAVPFGNLGWTDNIVADTVTAGVAGLFYPTSYYVGWCDLTSPVQVDGNWRVLVSGKSTAYSMSTVKNGGTPPPPTPGTYSSNPPLLAVRDYGAGRIAVWPIAASCVWQDAYHLLWGGGFMMSGQKNGMTGSAAQLLSNLFLYLWEPNQDTFGGYLPPPPAPPVPPQPIDWDNIQLTGCDLPNNYVGLIGAQSNLSVGSDTPQTFINAAKAVGYDFICFTEDLASMDETKWNSLKATCAANSDATFRAYPGYKYLDESGNSWVTFSDQLPWFGGSAYRSTLYPDRILKNGSFFYSLLYPPIILLSSHLNPENPWHQGMFHGFSVYTYQNGSLLDTSLDNYGKMNKMRYDVYPVAVHLVTSAAQVTAERNIGYQTNVRWDDNNVVNAMQTSLGTQTAQGNIRTLYWPTQVSEGTQSSQGPLVEDFRIWNGEFTYDLSQAGGDRMRLHVKASAPAGLSEVCIWDGDSPTPWRRFKPGGAQTFEETFDYFHDKQREPFVTLTDTAGKKAVGWVVVNHVYDTIWYRCSDNQNTMPRGKWWPVPENLQITRGIESYTASNVGFAPYSSFGSTNQPLPDLSPPAIEYYPVLAGRFGIILDEICEDHYPAGTATNGDQTDITAVAVSNTQLTGKSRNTFFTPRHDSTMAVLFEGQWTAITDVNLGDFIIWHPVYGRPADATTRYCVTQGGGVTDNPFPPGAVSGTLPNYGLMGAYPFTCHGSVGAVALQNGLTYHLSNDGTYVSSYLWIPAVNLQAGHTLQYQCLGLTSKLDPPADNTFVTGFVDKMGLDGTPAYTITPTLGTVTDTHYIARLAASGYGFSGTITETALPINLPVMIAGLNPNWDAGIWYRGTNTLVFPLYAGNEFDQLLGSDTQLVGTDQIIHIPVRSDGTGMLQIDTNVGAKDIYIGNLLVSDNPDIVLMLTDTRSGTKLFTAHNPTDSPITCTVQPGPGFTLLGNFNQAITVPAGSLVSVHANVYPTVSITSPAPGASSTAPATINITTNATDSDGTISKVEFYNNGYLVGTDTSSAGGWTYSWANVAASGSGGIKLTAKAYDNDNATTTSAQVNCTVTDANLKCYWKLDETSGSTATDTSGTGNNGTLYNSPTRGACKINYGLSFNGTSQYVQKASATGLPNVDANQTECFWFYVSSNPTATKTALAVTYDSSSNGKGLGMGFISSSGMKLGVWRNNNKALIVSTSTLPTAGTWHHAAYVKNGSNKYLYIDGTAVTSTSSTDTSSTATYITAGRTNYTNSPNYWPGKLDEIRIYDRALSATEISALAQGKQ